MKSLDFTNHLLYTWYTSMVGLGFLNLPPEILGGSTRKGYDMGI
jgi:hypothetical protein